MKTLFICIAVVFMCLLFDYIFFKFFFEKFFMFWKEFWQKRRIKKQIRNMELTLARDTELIKGIDIIKIINELRNSEERVTDQIINSWLEGYKSVEEENSNIYLNFIKDLVTEFGNPTYQGAGPRRDYKGIAPKHWTMHYRSAIDLAWWKKDSYTIFIMLTGHDADTLRQLIVAVSKFQIKAILPDNPNEIEI
ncbi:MAG: hypothetical protein WBP45_10445 [Daejeonella sp.]